jgi:hypothetical protein
MPYRIRKAPGQNLFWVVAQDGQHQSKEPIPYERAERQMKALYIAMRKKKELVGGCFSDESETIYGRPRLTGGVFGALLERLEE